MAELVDALDSGSSRETGGCSSHLDRMNYTISGNGINLSVEFLEVVVVFHSRIAIICSAPLHDSSKIKERIASFPVLIAVDGGLNHCHELGLHPDLLIGDFDSVKPDSLKKFAHLPKKYFPKDKDHTDLELAITCVFHSLVEEIVIFGALQGRTDHTLGNLILLSRFPGKVFLESHGERLFVIDKQVQFNAFLGQQISLIPLNGPVHGITTQGLKWELSEKTLDKHFIGISNEAINSIIVISVKEGDLLCCLNFNN